MKHNYQFLLNRYNRAIFNLKKFEKRLQKNLKSGEFKQFSGKKKRVLVQRIEKLKRQVASLSAILRGAVAAGALVMGLGFSHQAQAQFNMLETSTPLSSFFTATPNAELKSTFVDIDNDGDLDVFVNISYTYGEYNAGTTMYFENTGTAFDPTYTPRTGGDNPFDGVSVGAYQNLSFADLDDDGDLDAVFCASQAIYNGSYYNYDEALIFQFENTGSKTAPVFEEVSPGSILSGESFDPFSTIEMIDLDDDGDYDAVVSTGGGDILYYENQGTASVFSMTELTGTSNPFNSIDVGGEPISSFADVDHDGDYDLILGNEDGYINFFENTGTNEDPAFTLDNASINISGIDYGQYVKATMADIDADGDQDMFVSATSEDGYYTTSLVYFKNEHIPTGVSEEEALELSIYPNPATEYVTVSIKENITFLNLTKVDGTIISSYLPNSNAQTIDLAGIEQGMYIISLVSENGSTLNKTITKH